MYFLYKIKVYFLYLFILFISLYSLKINAQDFNFKIIGNENLDKEFIESIIIIDNDKYSNNDELVNYVIKELFSTGYFESVTAEINNEIITINLIENPVINKINFLNNNRFDDDVLENIINEKFIDIDVYNKSSADEIKNSLVQFYKTYGYNLVNISYSINNLDSGQINLNYNITEGEITKISKINIIGNESFSKRKIKSILRSSESKFYKLVSGRSKYNENLIYLDEKKIEEYYLNQGFKNIKVTSSISEFVKDTNKVILNYFIDEGKRFTITNIDIVFEDEISNIDIKIENIIKKLEIKNNKIYNKSKIDKSAEIIYNYMQKKGLIFIDVNPIEKEFENNINLVFLISKINEEYLSEINIFGNYRTKDKVIRREIELSEGDPFIPSKIKKSRSNLRNLNFFSKIVFKSYSIDQKVKLDIEVEDKPTGEFNIGAVFDSYEGVNIVSGIKENNIFGDGRYLAFNINSSQDNAGISFEVIEPYIRNKKFNLIYNVDVSSADVSTSSGYQIDTQTAGIGARYQLTDKITHYIKFDYAIEDYHSITSSASDSIKNKGGQNIEFYLSNRFNFSTLDTFFRPSEGYLTSFYNKLSVDNFVLNKLSYNKYYNINKNILSYRTELGNVTSLSSADVADGNKFSLGGRSLRGFDTKGVGPRNSSSGYIGGNNLLAVQVDYLIPISESENNLLDFVFFFDAGTVFENDTDPTNSSESVRISSGSGFNLNTPIGPLSLFYAIPIQSESYDKERKFVFSIGWVN